jgi:DNA polymerase III delta prime subunit
VTLAATRAELALAELRLRLAPLARALAVEVDRSAEVRARNSADRPSGRLSLEQHARMQVARATAFTGGPRPYGAGIDLSDVERDLVDRLAEQAARAGVRLPGQVLTDGGMGSTDLAVLLLAAAPALEPAFGVAYAYLQDAYDATAPGPALAVRLLATSADTERRVAEAAGPLGRLRSTGLVEASMVDRLTGALLRPAPGVVELLRGSTVDLGLLGLLPAPDDTGPWPAGVDADEVADVAEALVTGDVDLVGVWGAGRAGGDVLVGALCGAAPVVRVGPEEAESGLHRAGLAGGVCVVVVPEGATDIVQDDLVDVLTRSSSRVVLLADQPLRRSRLWAARRVAELGVAVPGRADARRLWAEAFPALADDTVDDLAGRYALGADEVVAVSALDRAARSWARNGNRPALDELAARVARPRSGRFADIRTPRRGRDLLVLPSAEEHRVLAVADDFRAWPRVAEAWRLDRFGSAGITALFAGPPGTGKTLAAEVIAGEVGLDLMVADLSLLVSKWVGETEKNLDAVFTEAGRSHCVLFFDEADTLFGHRGEVSRGADRYANLEVGYLLQRLDRYEGLVVLATNLRDQLDEAFSRRFHHLVHFSRPGPVERRRLWELVLAPPVVVEGTVDLEVLAELDLTGAGIAAVVRSAALLAHHEGRTSLRMSDLVLAVSRQFQREARLVPRDLLGEHAEVLG